MSYKIAIASGKGGTGKTTVSVSLFHFLNQKLKNKVQLIDCDVEEPNSLLFFNEVQLNAEKEAIQLVPRIDVNKCTFCKKCAEYCEFNAITVLPHLKHAEIDTSLCHSCGACSVACEFESITEYDQSIGKISSYQTEAGATMTMGKLKVGSAMQTMMIARTKEEMDEQCDVILLDSPPGTSCPVVETMVDIDYLILVTEPTPFGLHDVKLMIDLAKNMDKPFGLIINKSDLGNNDLYQFIKREKIELLGKIPFDKSYAANYSKGSLLENIPEKIEHEYDKIVSNLLLKFH